MVLYFSSKSRRWEAKVLINHFDNSKKNIMRTGLNEVYIINRNKTEIIIYYFNKIKIIDLILSNNAIKHILIIQLIHLNILISF